MKFLYLYLYKIHMKNGFGKLFTFRFLFKSSILVSDFPALNLRSTFFLTYNQFASFR